jgi:hypothetical protein
MIWRTKHTSGSGEGRVETALNYPSYLEVFVHGVVEAWRGFMKCSGTVQRKRREEANVLDKRHETENNCAVTVKNKEQAQNSSSLSACSRGLLMLFNY